MKASGVALMALGVCSLVAVEMAVFGLAPQVFGRDFLFAPYAQFIAFIIGIALIASGAVLRCFERILKDESWPSNSRREKLIHPNHDESNH